VNAKPNFLMTGQHQSVSVIKELLLILGI